MIKHNTDKRKCPVTDPLFTFPLAKLLAWISLRMLTFCRYTVSSLCYQQGRHCYIQQASSHAAIGT